LRIGRGMCCLMQGSSIPEIDMASVSIKINEDGSFNLHAGATDLGTGSDTVLAQIAAEVLGVKESDIIVYSSDTDITPFDVGAYASSTTYLSGNAAKKAAENVRSQIIGVAAAMMRVPAESICLENGKAISSAGASGITGSTTGSAASGVTSDVANDAASGVASDSARSASTGAKGAKKTAPTKKSVTLAEIACYSLYQKNQFQIMGVASATSHKSPPPFSAHFVEIAVDTETGQVKVRRYVAAVDCGQAINPQLAHGQTHGALMNGLSYALTERYIFDENGRMLNPGFNYYKIFSSLDAPEVTSILVESHEPSGPYGAKSISEICINGALPSISNAIYDAVGVRMTESPFTPDRVLAAIKAHKAKK
jgi:putative selenate reductase molybdopterin-binding subunit